MPKGVVQKGEEKLWDEAREHVERRTKKKLKKDKLKKDEIPWALVNHIFQHKKKHKEKGKTASLNTVDLALHTYLKKASDQETYTCEVSFKGTGGEPLDKLVDIISSGKEGVLLFDLDNGNGQLPEAIPVSKRTVQIEKDEAPDGVITLVITGNGSYTTEFTTFCLARSLFNLGAIGNPGHSFEVDFFPMNPQGKRESFGWDGDGSDSIKMDSIKVNGLKFDEEDSSKIKCKSSKPDEPPNRSDKTMQN